jgi:hypothetical protein
LHYNYELSVEELFESVDKFREKIVNDTIGPNDFYELMEIVEAIYEKGNENDREKIVNTLNSMEKEIREYSSPPKRHRKPDSRQPELF